MHMKDFTCSTLSYKRVKTFA